MSATRINKLTLEQEVALHKHAEEWAEIFFALGKVNRAIVEPIITELYQAEGLTKPTFVYVASPFAAQIYINRLDLHPWSNITKSMDMLYSRLRHGVESNISDSVGESILRVIGEKISTNIWDDVKAGINEHRLRLYITLFGGSHDALLPAYYLFCQQHIKPDIYIPQDLYRLNQCAQLARHCGWLYGFDDLCVVCDRPHSMYTDSEGRLHSLNGMAIEFGDGWGAYAINGVRVPPDIVTHPESITVERIFDEPNAEISRVMVEIYGEDRLMEHAKLIDDSGDPETGSLWCFYFHNEDEPIVKLKLRNSTQNSDGSYKTYWLRVPPHFKSAEAARAWTFYGNTDNFDPAVET